MRPWRLRNYIKLTKDNITLLGPGYFLNQNYDWNEAASAVFENIKVAGNGITIKGIVANKIITDYSASWESFHADNWTIEGCYLSTIEGRGYNSVIRGCYIENYVECPKTGLVTNNRD